jgi:excisionase family DNA binding protein
VINFRDLPDVMTPRDLQTFLPIGRDAVYALLASGDIRSVRAGQKYVVTKDSLAEWLKMETQPDRSPTKGLENGR